MDSESTNFETKEAFRNRDISEKEKKLQRLKEANPNKIAVIFEAHSLSKLVGATEMKYFCSKNLKIGYFSQDIIKKCKLSAETSLYFCCSDNRLIKSDAIVADLYEKYKNPDGYLYVQFREIQSLGSFNRS